jgi:hypothetical protein
MQAALDEKRVRGEAEERARWRGQERKVTRTSSEAGHGRMRYMSVTARGLGGELERCSPLDRLQGQRRLKHWA